MDLRFEVCGQLILAGEGYPNPLGMRPLEPLDRCPNCPSRAKLRFAWKMGPSQSLHAAASGLGPPNKGNFPPCSLAGGGTRQHTEMHPAEFIMSFINILCYKNIFGKITLIASFFVFYYILKELFMIIHRGAGER